MTTNTVDQQEEMSSADITILSNFKWLLVGAFLAAAAIAFAFPAPVVPA